jgi:hypothetical protein
MYDYITNLRKQQAQGIQNHESTHIQNTEQGKARHRKYTRLKLGGGQEYDRSIDQTAAAARVTFDRA